MIFCDNYNAISFGCIVSLVQNSEKDPQYFKERAHIFKQYNALVQKRKTGVNQRNDNRVAAQRQLHLIF